jgi:hypothetical protein
MTVRFVGIAISALLLSAGAVCAQGRQPEATSADYGCDAACQASAAEEERARDAEQARKREEEERAVRLREMERQAAEAQAARERAERERPAIIVVRPPATPSLPAPAPASNGDVDCDEERGPPIVPLEGIASQLFNAGQNIERWVCTDGSVRLMWAASMPRSVGSVDIHETKRCPEAMAIFKRSIAAAGLTTVHFIKRLLDYRSNPSFTIVEESSACTKNRSDFGDSSVYIIAIVR